MNDIKFTFRQLLKDPGFTAMAVLTLALVFFQLVGPGKPNLLFDSQAPNNQTGRHYTNHRSHALGLGIEGSVAKQAADKVCCLILPDRQNDETVPSVTERTCCQAQVPREERWTRQGTQERKNLLVGYAFTAQSNADLADRNIPASQQLALALKDVFVQDVHAPWSDRQFMGVFSERLPRRAHRLRDGFLRDAAAQFFNDARPGHSAGNLLQHIRHKNPRASKRRLPMANLRIRDDVTAHDFLFHSATTNTPFSPPRQRSESINSTS